MFLRPVVYIYFVLFGCVSLGALLKCILDPNEDLKCPMYKTEIHTLLAPLQMQTILSGFFKVLDYFGKDVLNFFIMSGYLVIISGIATIIYVAFKMQLDVLKKILNILIQILVCFFLLCIILTQLSPDNPVRDSIETFVNQTKEVIEERIGDEINNFIKDKINTN